MLKLILQTQKNIREQMSLHELKRNLVYKTQKVQLSIQYCMRMENTKSGR
jgi:hypothetical protein